MTDGFDGGGPSENDFSIPPPQLSNRPNSYNSSMWPFASDPALDDQSFGFFQDLYHTGFADPNVSPTARMNARADFISFLGNEYGESFDWDTWREEYNAYG